MADLTTNMTGPEHYLVAEQFADSADQFLADWDYRGAEVRAQLAQAHAALAATAAQVLSNIATGPFTGALADEWRAVIDGSRKRKIEAELRDHTDGE